MAKKKLFIDASPLLDPRLSGIGHTVLSMIRVMSSSSYFKDYDLCLIVPYLKRKRLDQYRLTNVRIKSVLLPARVWNVWPRFLFMPPIDLFFGRGVYLFMNYKRWPLVFSKSVTYVYDANFAIYPEYVEARNLRMLQSNLRRWMSQSSRIVTISAASKKELVEHANAPADKISVIYCGVDTDFMRPASSADIKEVKSRYAIEGEYLMFLSNIEPRKNIENLLKALRLLPDEYKKRYSLVLIGGMAWSNDAIMAEIDKTRAEGWRIIKPTSYVPDADLPALLSGAKLLIHPAFHEGFGISPLQAMACGTPVAVSDLPVMHETIGENGTFFNPHSPQAISEALRGIMTHTQTEDEASKGRERAAEFSWNRAVQRLSKLMSKL